MVQGGARCSRRAPRVPECGRNPQGLRSRRVPRVSRVTLLDTNTVIFYLKGQESVVFRLQATAPRELAVPSVVAYEIEYGTRKLGPARRLALTFQLLACLSQV